MDRDLDELLYTLSSDERPTVAQAARTTSMADHDLCQALYDLGRVLLENDALDAAEAVCERLDWIVERAELQGRLGEQWYRVGRVDRAGASFDAAEATARSEPSVEKRAGALADLAILLVRASEDTRATRVRNLAIEEAVAGQRGDPQTKVDCAKVLRQMAKNLADESACEAAESVALKIEIPAIREAALSSCEGIRSERKPSRREPEGG